MNITYLWHLCRHAKELGQIAADATAVELSRVRQLSESRSTSKADQWVAISLTLKANHEFPFEPPNRILFLAGFRTRQEFYLYRNFWCAEQGEFLGRFAGIPRAINPQFHGQYFGSF